MTGVGRLRESNHKESLPNRILDTSTLVELFCEQFRYVKLHVVNINVVLAYPCSEVHTVSYSADSDHRDPSQCIMQVVALCTRAQKNGKIIKLSNQKVVAKANFPVRKRSLSCECFYEEERRSQLRVEPRPLVSWISLSLTTTLPRLPAKIPEKFKHINNQTEPLNRYIKNKWPYPFP